MKPYPANTTGPEARPALEKASGVKSFFAVPSKPANDKELVSPRVTSVTTSKYWKPLSYIGVSPADLKWSRMYCAATSASFVPGFRPFSESEARNVTYSFNSLAVIPGYVWENPVTPATSKISISNLFIQ